MTQPTVDEQLAHLARGAHHPLDVGELRLRLDEAHRTSRPLRVKVGLDPAESEVHLGHAVVLRKLRQFQEMGHQAVVVVESLFGLLGDLPKEAGAGAVLSDPETRSRAYLDQVGRAVNLDRTEVVYDSRWYQHMGVDDLLRVCANLSVDEVLSSFRDPDSPGGTDEVRLDRFLFPLMRAYDSVMVQADVEIAGEDRMHEMSLARTLQERTGMTGQVALPMPLLVGTDGKLKMTTALGNHVPFVCSPSKMHARLMSLPDVVLRSYLELLTDLSADRIDDLLADGADLRIVREELAQHIVSEYYNRESATAAANEFKRVFTEHRPPADVPTRTIAEKSLTRGRIPVVDLLVRCGLADSAAQAGVSVRQGRTYVDGRRVTDAHAELPLKSGCIIQVGNSQFARIVVKRNG